MNAEPTSINPTPPPATIDFKTFDGLCGDYLYWKGIEDGAKKESAGFKEKIVAEIERFGSVPDNAPKSKRVSAAHHVATMTVGTSVEVDDDAAADLENLLKEYRLGKLFGSIFTSRREFSLVKNAHVFITTHKWPARIESLIHLAYLRCFSAKTNAASLNVETQQDITARAEAAIAELAAKAVKASGKKAA
jgi:hypothetical protein